MWVWGGPAHHWLLCQCSILLGITHDFRLLNNHLAGPWHPGVESLDPSRQKGRERRSYNPLFCFGDPSRSEPLTTVPRAFTCRIVVPEKSSGESSQLERDAFGKERASEAKPKKMNSRIHSEVPRLASDWLIALEALEEAAQETEVPFSG